MNFQIIISEINNLHVWLGLLSIPVLGGIGAYSLTVLNQKFKKDDEKQELANQINGILPQTQCAQCGYPGCKPYAQAISEGEAIDKCVPGGNEVIEKISLIIGSSNSTNKIVKNAPISSVAFINEEDCIGCTKCLQICPVDAIIGSVKKLHTVFIKDCTGCNLCIPVCPTGCIDLLSEEQLIKKLKQPIISKTINKS